MSRSEYRCTDCWHVSRTVGGSHAIDCPQVGADLQQFQERLVDAESVMSEWGPTDAMA